MSTVQLSDLDKVAARVCRAQEVVAAIELIALRDGPMASRLAAETKETLTTAALSLGALGATLPQVGGTGADRGPDVPIHLLDSPANRRLLAALEEAAAAGAAVDRERGHVDRSGEPIGWGEQLGGLALTIRMECQGPAGRD